MTFLSKPRSILSLAVTGLLFTSVACNDTDERKVDRQVEEMMHASEKGRRNPTTQNLNSALAELTKAANQTGASLTTKIKAKSTLALAEFDAAQRAARELAALRPQINRVMWDLSQSADQIASLNGRTKAAQSANPEPTLKAVADKKAAMVTAGEAAAKKAAELQAEIDKLKGQIATLTEQKTAATTEADTQADKATKLADKEAAPVLDQAGEARRKAALIGHDIDKLTAALLPLERDLAAEQGKKKNADEGVAALDAQGKAFEANWQATQQTIGQTKAIADKHAQELTQKAAELTALTKQADDLRAAAADQFTKSADHYASASDDARNLSTELGKWSNDARFATSPEKAAWDALIKTYNFNVFKLYGAESRNALANLHTAHLAQLQNQEKLAATISKTLQDAQITPPPALAASLKDQIEAARASADKQYVDAADKFASVYGVATNPKDVRLAAHIARMLSLYGQYLNGDKTKLDEAKAEYKETFSEENANDPIIRSLPAELRPAS